MINVATPRLLLLQGHVTMAKRVATARAAKSSWCMVRTTMVDT